MRQAGSLLHCLPGGRVAAVLLTSAVLLFSESASAQSSCVRVTNASWVPSCPCDAGSELVFIMEGETTVEANTVNLAVIIDSSGTVDDTERNQSIKFAKNTVEAFADLNLFENGGTASFAQFASSASEGGTFATQTAFNTFVETTPRIRGGTDIDDGIARGRELLPAPSSGSTSFMVVITDGRGSTDLGEADAARAEGTIMFAVGVGDGRDDDTLAAIAGDTGYTFDAADFSELNGAFQGIVSAASGSTIRCPATGAAVTLAFDTGVTAVASGSAAIGGDGTTVVFEVPDLENNPVEFVTVLDTCGMGAGTGITASATYSDTEANDPDLLALEGPWDMLNCAVTPPTRTPAPTTPEPTTAAPSTPVTPPTPAPATIAPVTPAPATPPPRTSAPLSPPLTPAPATIAPVTAAPATRPPTTSAPLSPPLTPAPAAIAPVTPAPATPPPTTSAPFSPPLTPAPATIAPVTPAPATPPPTTSAPLSPPLTPAPVKTAPMTPAPATSAPDLTLTPSTIAPTDPAATTPPPATEGPATPAPSMSAPSSTVAPTPRGTGAPSPGATTQPTRDATAPPSSAVTVSPSPSETAPPSPIATSLPSTLATAPPSSTATAPPSSATTVQPSLASVVGATPAPTASSREVDPVDGTGGSPDASPTSAVSESPTDAPATTSVTSVASPTQEAAGSAGGTMSGLALSGFVLTTIGTVLGGAFGVSDRQSRSVFPLREEQQNAGARNPARAAKSASIRLPSATMALMLVAQAQFLAMLSLVESTGADSSILEYFVGNLRWINLWPPASFSETFLPRSMLDDLEEDSPDEASGGMSTAVFLGNIALFLGLLLIIIIVHIAVASAIEAYWLTKKRATERLAKAQLSGTEAALGIARTGTSDDTDTRADQPGEGSSGNDVAARHSRLNLDKIVECREKSRSAWLHFPHVELVFMMFAFEGAVACQVSTIRDNVSPLSFFLALVTLLLFPALMLVMVMRTFWVKIRPGTNIFFHTYADDDSGSEGNKTGRGGFFRSTRSFGTNVHVSLKEKHSMFAWANKGQWESVETQDNKNQRERDWFRIGFEPIFVDFTKNGSWFVVYTLIEWAALGVVGGVVNDSVLQLSLFCAMHTVSFLLLVVLKPFANRVVNGMGIALCGINAICMAVLVVSASVWKGSPKADRVDKAVTITQLVTLAALIIPVYVDTSFVMIGALRRKCLKNRDKDSGDDDKQRSSIKRYVRRAWARMWWTMLGKNVLALCHDTAAGIRYSSTNDTE